MYAFFHGVILALGLILPLGVQNLFVFNQGVVQPQLLRAMPVVIAASLCDMFLILLSVQGVSLFLLEFGSLKTALVVMGTAFLGYMGWLTWNTRAMQSDQPAAGLSLRQQVGFAVTVSLLNPHAILDTIGVIGTSSIQYQGQDKLLFTAACILVSWLWFLLLAASGHLLGSQDWFLHRLGVINKLSAAFMWGSAVYMIYSVL